MDTNLSKAFVCHTLIAQKRTRRTAAAAGLSVRELQCMMQIHLRNPCCVRKLTEILDTKATATSKLLRSLDERGLIKRCMDKHDRRIERITLTRKGETLTLRCVHLLSLEPEEIAEEMPEVLRSSLAEHLSALNRHIQATSSHS